MYLAPSQWPSAGAYTLVPFDLDAGRAGVDQVTIDHEFLGRLLRRHHIGFVPVMSGPSGGRHLWTASSEPVPAQLVYRIAALLAGIGGGAALCPSVDPGPLTNPAVGCLRPPGSPHRDGGHAQLLSHTLDDALQTLSAGAPPAAYEALARDLTTKADRRDLRNKRSRGVEHSRERRHPDTLPPSVVNHGDPVRRVNIDATGHVHLQVRRRALPTPATEALQRVLRPEEDHSAHAFRVLLSLALAGWRYGDVHALVRAPDASPGLEGLRTARRPGHLRVVRPEHAAESLLARQWRLAVERAARLPRSSSADVDPFPEVTAAVDDLMHRIDAAGPERWACQSGPADLNVLRAIGLVMLMCGQMDVAVDCRRLALLAGVSRQTANVAVRDRLIPDGWIREVSAADPHRHQARVVAIADGHVCAGHRRHRCAPYTGSDTRANARRERGCLADKSAKRPYNVDHDLSGRRLELTDQLRTVLTDAASDVWSALGHHAARTYEALQNGVVNIAELAARTGYQRRTIRRHLYGLAQHRLVHAVNGKWARTKRVLSEAAADLDPPHRGRGLERAVTYALETVVHQWWQAEVAWRRLSRDDKRRRGRRAPATQTVLPHDAAAARAYPRDAAGRPDHETATRIEAERLDTAALICRAHLLAANGEEVDLVQLLHAAARSPTEHPGPNNKLAQGDIGLPAHTA
jgi:hypothetical protein